MLPFLLILFFISITFGETIYIASASSLRSVLPQIISMFKDSFKEANIKVSYASSGHIYAQIAGGAPYDVFISADPIYAKRLIDRGLADVNSYTEFAKGILVLYSTHEYKNYKDALSSARKIAIASPKHAPYGKCAIEFLRNVGLYEKVKNRLVYGSNVAQATQFVYSGGAQVGLVALSLVQGRNYILELPKLYTPILHSAVITLKGKDNKLASEFIKFLTSLDVQRILKENGFERVQ